MRSNERLAQQPQLGAGGKRAGGQERPRRGWQRDRAGVADDETSCRDRARIDALVADVKAPQQIIDQRRAIEHAVGAELIQRSIALSRFDHAAGAPTGFEHFHPQSALLQLERRDQAGNARAHYQHVAISGHRCHACRAGPRGR